MAATTKVLEIKLSGNDSVVKGIVKLKDAVTLTAEQIGKLKDQLAGLLEAPGGDSAQVENLKKQIAALEQTQKEYNETLQNGQEDLKAQAELEKILADIELKKAQAQKVAAQEETERLQAAIAQEKELDRQIDREEKQQAAINKTKAALDAIPGSYRAIVNAQKELRPLIQNATEGSQIPFQGQNISFAEAIEQYKQLSFAEQAFRRQFQADGTLVGEYSSGIIKAFKEIGAEDIFTNQITKAKEEIDSLKVKTEQLVEEYRHIQTESVSSLESIDQQIKRNIETTQKLSQTVEAAGVNQKTSTPGTPGQSIDPAIQKNIQEIERLKAETELLQQQYKATSEQGSISINELSSRIQQSVVATDRLSQSVEKAEISLKGVGSIGGKVAEGIREGFSHIGEQLSQFVLFYFGFQQALLGIESVFEKSVEEFEKSEKAATSLKNAIKNVGGTKQDIAALDNQVEQLTTKFKSLNENDLRLAQGRLVTFGKLTRDQILQITPVIVDFARNSGKSIDEATESILKGLEGQGRGLKAYGIELGKNQTVTERFNIIQKELGERVKGSADIFEKTSAGQLADYHEAIIRVEENLGKTFVPILADALKSLIPFLQAAGNALGFLIKAVTAIPFGALITGIVALKIAFSLYKKEIVEGTIAQEANNGATLLGFLRNQAQRLGLLASAAASRVKTAALGAETIATEEATIATEELNAVSKFNPLGLILTAVALLIPAISAFGSELGSTTKKIDDQAEKTKALAEIQGELNTAVTQDIGSQINKVGNLVSILHDNNSELYVRKKAYEELIAISPDFIGTVDAEYKATDKLDQVYNRFIFTLRTLALARAQAALREKVANELVAKQAEVFEREQDAAAEKRANAEIERQNKIKLAQDAANKQTGTQTFAVAGLTNLKLESTSDAEKKKLDEARKGEEEVSKKSKELDEFQTRDLKAREKRIQDLEKIILQLNSNRTKAGQDLKLQLEGQLKTEREALALAQGIQEKSNLGGLVSEGLGKEVADKLTVDEDNAFKRLDAIRDRELLKLETWKAQIEVTRKLTLTEEEHYLSETLRINNENLTAKAAILEKVKNRNAEEEKVLAEFNKKKLDNQIQFNKDIAAARKAEFDILNKQLEGQLQNQNLIAKGKVDIQLENPNLTNVARLDLQKKFLDETLQNQITFNEKQKALEIQLKQNSTENEEKRKQSIQKILNDEVALRKQTTDAVFNDITETAARQLDVTKENIAQRTIDILESEGSYYEKSKKLAALQVESQKEVLANQVAADKIALDKANEFRNSNLIAEKEYQQALAKLKSDEANGASAEQIAADKLTLSILDAARKNNLISEKKYQDILAKYKTDEAALAGITTNAQLTAFQRLTEGLKQFAATFKESVLGIKSYTDDAAGEKARIEDATKQTAQTLNKAISDTYKAYFDNQSKQIDREKQASLDFLTREQARVTAVSQSSEETATIQREYDQKRAQVEKKAGNDKKKLALKEAAIDYGVAVVKTFAEFGFPIGLIPVAALTLAYFLQRSNIQAQQFAGSGKATASGKTASVSAAPSVAPIPVSAGKITTPSNIVQQKNGDDVLATVKRGEVVLNEQHQRAIGGPKVFRSIGVPGFAGGGVMINKNYSSLQHYATGGSTYAPFGASLKAPEFTSSSFTNNSVNLQSDERIQKLASMTESVLKAVYASDSKEVILNPHKVTSAQSRKRKDISLGKI